jgi:hypothetical protein
VRVRAWRERTRMPNFGLMDNGGDWGRRTRYGAAAAADGMRGEHVEIRHRRELSTMAARDDTRTELGRRQQRKKINGVTVRSIAYYYTRKCITN